MSILGRIGVALLWAVVLGLAWYQAREPKPMTIKADRRRNAAS